MFINLTMSATKYKFLLCWFSLLGWGKRNRRILTVCLPVFQIHSVQFYLYGKKIQNNSHHNELCIVRTLQWQRGNLNNQTTPMSRDKITTVICCSNTHGPKRKSFVFCMYLMVLVPFAMQIKQLVLYIITKLFGYENNDPSFTKHFCVEINLS